MGIVITLFISFIIRVFLIPLSGFKADIAYWKWWGMSAAHDGITGPLVNTAYNYPSFYLYILKTTSHLYELFTNYNFKNDPSNTYFWNDQNLVYLSLIKLPYILADLAIGFLIYKIVSEVLIKNTKLANKKRNIIAIVSACLYTLNPVVIYNSSIWGQTDSIGSFFVLLAFYFLLQKRLILLGIFSAISVFMKTQTIIFLPIFFLLSLTIESSTLKDKNHDKKLSLSFNSLITTLWSFIATIIVINLPFLANHLMDRVFDIMYTSQLYFPYVSMNAYNLWWIFYGKTSPSFLDQNHINSFLTFKTAGILLFGFVYSLGILIIGKLKFSNEINPEKLNFVKNVLSTVVIISFAFFMLLTQMHERYIFPIFAFFPILLGLEFIEKKKWKFYSLLTLFLALSILILINLHQVMIMNYPDNTLPFLPNVFDEKLTIIVAVLNLIVFLFCLILLTSYLSNLVKTATFFFFVIILVALNFSQSLTQHKKVISLTKLKPTYIKQGFGSLSINKNLSNNWMASLYYYANEGLATHAYSQIEYDLNSKYDEFTTMYGIDNDANTSASVIFMIKGDDKILFRSQKMTRYSQPGYARVLTSKVKKLILIVEDANDGINSDHADWLDPRLYKY